MCTSAGASAHVQENVQVIRNMCICAGACALFIVRQHVKTEYIKLLQAINTHYLDTCVAMLYSAIKVPFLNDFRTRSPLIFIGN